MTHDTCRLTAKNRDQLRNPALGNRLWATFTFSSGGKAKGKMTRTSGASAVLRVSSLSNDLCATGRPVDGASAVPRVSSLSNDLCATERPARWMVQVLC